MTRILLLSKYSRLGASSRLRTQQYIPYLQEQGCEVTVYPLFDDAYLQAIYAKKNVSKLHLIKLFLSRIFVLLTVKKFDLIWIEYEVFPYTPALFEKLLSLLGVKFIVDYDDAIFHNYDLSGNPLIKRFLSQKIDSVMRSATHVVVGNDYLKQRALDAGAENITLIPTVVDYSRYSIKMGSHNNPIKIGWIGSPSTQKYVLALLPVFLRLKEHYDIEVVLVGANDAAIEQLKGISTKVEPWSEDTEAKLVSEFDIGIMPLKDGPWEKGKCGYKLIQYMACSVPIIASPVGVNTSIVQNNNCGYLADNNESWFIAFESLIKSKERRIALGSNGRQAVINKFSLQAQQSKLLNCLSSIKSI